MWLSPVLFFSKRHNCNGVLKVFELFFFVLGAQLDKIGFTVIKKCINAVKTRGNDQSNKTVLIMEGMEQLVCF